MPMKDDREYRSMTMAVEPNSENKIVTGYATTFNQPYLLRDFGDYRVEEQIDSRAFDECDMSDVITFRCCGAGAAGRGPHPREAQAPPATRRDFRA